MIKEHQIIKDQRLLDIIKDVVEKADLNKWNEEQNMGGLSFTINNKTKFIRVCELGKAEYYFLIPQGCWMQWEIGVTSERDVIFPNLETLKNAIEIYSHQLQEEEW